MINQVSMNSLAASRQAFASTGLVPQNAAQAGGYFEQGTGWAPTPALQTVSMTVGPVGGGMAAQFGDPHVGSANVPTAATGASGVTLSPLVLLLGAAALAGLVYLVAK